MKFVGVYGEQSRDFTFVKNVVDANILYCESDKIGIFNIVCGRKIPINELVDYITETLGRNMKLEYSDSRAGDIKYYLAVYRKPRILDIIQKAFSKRN